MIRVKLRFIGRVQGVGFRYFAQMNAEKFHVTGWVMNLSDGSVAAEAQGSKLQIRQFIDAMEHGHRFMRIDEIEKEEIAYIDGEKRFRVTYY